MPRIKILSMESSARLPGTSACTGKVALGDAIRHQDASTVRRLIEKATPDIAGALDNLPMEVEDVGHG